MHSHSPSSSSPFLETRSHSPSSSSPFLETRSLSPTDSYWNSPSNISIGANQRPQNEQPPEIPSTPKPGLNQENRAAVVEKKEESENLDIEAKESYSLEKVRQRITTHSETEFKSQMGFSSECFVEYEEGEEAEADQLRKKTPKNTLITRSILHYRGMTQNSNHISIGEGFSDPISGSNDERPSTVASDEVLFRSEECVQEPSEEGQRLFQNNAEAKAGSDGEKKPLLGIAACNDM